MKRKSTRKERNSSSRESRGRAGPDGPAAVPYPASWVDRLIDAIRGLPMPSWLFYLLLCIGILILIVAGSWIDGSAPIGRFMLPALYAIVPVYPVGLLAAIHYADDTAHRSFEAFRPALGLGPDEASRLLYELTTLPARPAWLAGAVGAAFTALVMFLSDVVGRFPAAPVVVSIVVLVGILGFALTATLLYHTVRQLRLVSSIHKAANAVDLFQPAPLHAFARLSAQTGLVFVLAMYFDFAANPETYANAALLWLNTLGFPVMALACFLLPLLGMHGRLVREKRRLESEVNRRLQAGILHLYRRVDGVDLKDADALNKTIGSLIMTRDVIAKIPTWPWQPGTFTLFISAVALPLIVFLIQAFLDSVLGFK